MQDLHNLWTHSPKKKCQLSFSNAKLQELFNVEYKKQSREENKVLFVYTSTYKKIMRTECEVGILII